MVSVAGPWAKAALSSSLLRGSRAAFLTCVSERQNSTTNPLLSRCMGSTTGAWQLGKWLATLCSSRSCFRHVLGQQLDVLELLLHVQTPEAAIG